MKKIISLLMLLVLCCCAIPALADDAQPPADVTNAMTEQAVTDMATILDKQGEEGVVTLLMTGNPTTGYDWVTAILDDEVVSMESEYAAADASGETMTGEGGLYLFTIKGLKAGETAVTFQYMQSWDETSTVVGLTYIVKVDEDLKVSVTSSLVGV